MNEPYITRQTLLQRAKDQDDSKAWEELIDFYKNYIYVIIRSMGIHHHDSEDILQKVSLRMWKGLPKYQYTPGKAKFRGWVSTVTKNAVLAFIDKRKKHAEKLERAEKENTLTYLDSIRLPEIELIAEKEWQIFITTLALENISSHFSEAAIEAFKLYTKGLKVREISQELDIKEDSIYKYITRIKKRFINEIKRLKDESEF